MCVSILFYWASYLESNANIVQVKQEYVSDIRLMTTCIDQQRREPLYLEFSTRRVTLTVAPMLFKLSRILVETITK